MSLQIQETGNFDITDTRERGNFVITGIGDRGIFFFFFFFYHRHQRQREFCHYRDKRQIDLFSLQTQETGNRAITDTSNRLLSLQTQETERNLSQHTKEIKGFFL